MTFILPGGLGQDVPATGGSTWDPAHGATSLMTLSNNNKTTTGTSATVLGSIRGTKPRGTTGKWYFECNCSSWDSSEGTPYLGWCNASFNITDTTGSTYPGQDTAGNSGSIIQSAPSGPTNMYYQYQGLSLDNDPSGSFALPGIIGVAIDFTNGAIYFLSGTYWYLGYTPDGVAGSITFPKTAAVYPAVSVSHVGPNAAVATLNTVAPFNYAVPTGYTAWG